MYGLEYIYMCIYSCRAKKLLEVIQYLVSVITLKSRSVWENDIFLYSPPSLGFMSWRKLCPDNMIPVI